MGFINEIGKVILYSLLSLILIIFTGGIISAEIREGDFITGISGGVLSVDRGNTDPALRIDLGYHITRHIDIEASIITTMNYNNNNFTSVTITPLLHLSPEKPISPYLTLGGGIALFDISGDDSTKPTIIIGGGINYSIIEGISLRFDLRDYITKDNSMRNNLAFSVGMIFYFDPVKEGEVLTPAPQKAPETPATTTIESPPQPEITGKTEKLTTPETSATTTPLEKKPIVNIPTESSEKSRIEKEKEQPVHSEKMEARAEKRISSVKKHSSPQKGLKESIPAQEKIVTHKKNLPVKKEKALKKSSAEEKAEKIEKGSYGSGEENILELIKEDKKTYKGKSLKKKI